MSKIIIYVILKGRVTAKLQISADSNQLFISECFSDIPNSQTNVYHVYIPLTYKRLSRLHSFNL